MPITLKQALDDYPAARTARNSAATVKGEGHVLRRFVATVADGKDIQVRHLRAEHVEAWFVSLRAPHTDRRHVARPPIQAATWNYYLARVKQFFAYCVAKRWTTDDLLRLVGPLKVPTKIRQQPHVRLLLAMLDAARSPRDRALLALAMNTGLRSNEITSLRVGDVDLDGGNLRVVISKSQIEDDMPVTADLDRELRVWLATYAGNIGRPLIPEDYLIPPRVGPRYRWVLAVDGTRERIQTEPSWIPHRPLLKAHLVVQGVMATLGLETRHEGVHTVRRAVARHYFDSLVGQLGYDGALRVVSALLHHQSTHTTEGYVGLSTERRTRDESLRGQSFLILPPEENVVPLHRKG